MFLIGACPADATTLAFVGGRIYPAPAEAPIAHGTLLVTDGKITAVGDRDKIRVPPRAVTLDCTGLVLTAGFWNSHVHFIEPKWHGAATIPALQLSTQLEGMLTRYGYTHVFEIATLFLDDSLALRRRVASGEVVGPEILTTGLPIAGPKGSPIYIAPMKLHESPDATDAQEFARKQFAAGADGLKLFTGSPNGTEVVLLPVTTARAAVSIAHQLKKPVFAHPTTVAGVKVALESGVDILAHVSPDRDERWSPELVQQLIAAHMALIPTLKLYSWDPPRQGATPQVTQAVVKLAEEQLRVFSDAGGQVLFGTDVGYVTDYDPSNEYILMREAGLSFDQILASLTTAPANRFGRAERSGELQPGMDADVVVLRGDPKDNPAAFADVRYVYRAGQRIYPRQ